MTKSIITITETENGFRSCLVVDDTKDIDIVFQELNLTQKYAVALHQLGSFDPIPVIALVLSLVDGDKEYVEKAVAALLQESKELKEEGEL